MCECVAHSFQVSRCDSMSCGIEADFSVGWQTFVDNRRNPARLPGLLRPAPSIFRASEVSHSHRIFGSRDHSTFRC